MRNNFLADILSKIERVAVSALRIRSQRREPEAAGFPVKASRVWPGTYLLCALATSLLVTLCACSAADSKLREWSAQAQQLVQPKKAEEPTPVAQAAPPAKPTHQGKKPEPKPEPKSEPTEQDLFEYVRGKLLSLSPADGINDNVEVSYDAVSATLSITQPDGRCDIFLNSLDTNSAIWEVLDPSDAYHPRGDILRLTMTSSSGKPARICYDNQNQIDRSISANRVRLLFAQNKANAVPDFAYNMTKAIKKLVVLSGGAAEKKVF
jgi:hypothetical protein